MSNNKMLIDATHPEETRVVVLRGGRVEEFDYESAARKQLRGNIYLAKVTRVEPSLQAAFVDYGGNRHGFLAFNEIHPDYYQIPFADRQALLDEEAAAEAAEEAEADARAEAGNRNRRRRRSKPKGRGTGRGGARADSNTEADADTGADAETEVVQPLGPIALAASIAGGPAIVEPVEDEAEDGADHADFEAGARAGDGDDLVDEADEDGEPELIEAKAADYDDEDDEDDEDQDEDDEDEDDARAEDESNGGNGDTEAVEQVALEEDALEEVPSRQRRRPRSYKIQEVIKRRQVILVQVVKEERGNKGAALTTYLSLAGRYTVLMPNTGRGGGISRKITTPQDRKRLKSIAQELEVPEGMGLIIRTAGASRTKQEIKRDFEYLLRLWESVREMTLESTAPTLVYEEGNLIKRSIRDHYTKDVDEVQVAGEHAYRDARDFMRMLMPSHARNVIAYTDPEPLFSRFQIERQLNAMFSPYVTLKSGGYLVINQTEALVAIDINSGKSTREFSIEETALNTNLEAADEIARQLKLRDLAGLIVVDFIDMEEKRNNRSVERQMKDALRTDRARIQVGRISAFGLLKMSRQRLRTGVLEGSTTQCPHCQGTGIVRSTESVALAVLRGLEDALMANGRQGAVATTTAAVALYILNNKRDFIVEMERRYGVPIAVQASDKLQGANFSIERTAAAAQPVRRVERAAVNMNWGFDEEDLEDAEPSDVETEAEADDEASTADVEAGPDGDENGRGRGRKRRRRRGRRGDREDREATDEGEVRQSAAHDDEDDDEDEETSEQSGAHADAGDDNDDSGEAQRSRRGRRRGRRGGRRSRERVSEAAATDAEAADNGAAPGAVNGSMPGMGPQPDVDVAFPFETPRSGEGRRPRRRGGRRGGRRWSEDLVGNIGAPSAAPGSPAAIAAALFAGPGPSEPEEGHAEARPEAHDSNGSHLDDLAGEAIASTVTDVAPEASVTQAASSAAGEAVMAVPSETEPTHAAQSAEGEAQPVRRRRNAEPTASEPRLERVVVGPDQLPPADAADSVDNAEAAPQQPTRRGWWQRRLLGGS